MCYSIKKSFRYDIENEIFYSDAIDKNLFKKYLVEKQQNVKCPLEINRFSNYLHILFNDYLQNNYYDIIKNSIIKKKLKKLLKSYHIGICKGNFSIERLFCFGFEKLNETLSTKNTREIALNTITDIKYFQNFIPNWRFAVLKKIENTLLKQKNKYRFQYIGSIGDRKIVNYSDLDAIYIPNKQDLLNPISILKIKKLIQRLTWYAYQFDPQQRHPIFFLSPYQIMQYSGSFYPLQLLKGKWGYGLKHIKFNKKKGSNPKNFLIYCQNLRRRYINNELQSDPYGLKFLLGIIYLLPTYYYNALGYNLTKGEAIRRFKEEMPLLYELFSNISEYRENWPFIRFPINFYQIPDFAYRLINPSLIQNFVRKAKYKIYPIIYDYFSREELLSLNQKALTISECLLEKFRREKKIARN